MYHGYYSELTVGTAADKFQLSTIKLLKVLNNFETLVMLSFVHMDPHH